MQPLGPGTARWRVLDALGQRAAAGKPFATAPALAVDVDQGLEVVLRAIAALRVDGLVEVSAWAAIDTLHRITAAGELRLAQGGQLALL